MLDGINQAVDRVLFSVVPSNKKDDTEFLKDNDAEIIDEGKDAGTTVVGLIDREKMDRLDEYFKGHVFQAEVSLKYPPLKQPKNKHYYKVTIPNIFKNAIQNPYPSEWTDKYEILSSKVETNDTVSILMRLNPEKFNEVWNKVYVQKVENATEVEKTIFAKKRCYIM